MPTPPEFAEAAREIWRQEICGKVKALQLGQPNRDERVACEIAINLERVADEREQQVPGLVIAGGVEDRVHNDGGGIGHTDLEEEAPSDEQQPQLDLARGKHRSAVDLRQETVGAHNGTGDQLRKEREIDGQTEEVRRVPEFPPVEVDRVAKSVKCIERDTDRQHNSREPGVKLQPETGRHLRERANEEIEVFEERQNGKTTD